MEEIGDTENSQLIVLELTKNTFKKVMKITVLHLSAVRLVAAQKCLKESSNCEIRLRSSMKDEIKEEDAKKVQAMLRETIKSVICGVSQLFDGLLCPTSNKILPVPQKTGEGSAQ